MTRQRTEPVGDDVPSDEDDASSDGRADVFEELVRAERELRETGERLVAADARMGTDRLVDVVRHGPVLEALRAGPLDRREMEDRLDVSRATSHRLVRWLETRGLVEREDGRFHLTGTGMGFADEVLRFERNVSAFDRLAPLCDRICEHHQEFVIGPFADARVTTADPGDPYAPISRFLELLAESTTLRGFNTTHMVPPTTGGFPGVTFEGVEVELVSLPSVVESLFEGHPERVAEACERGDLTLRTREALPYGLAIFDGAVGIGGFDETTGAMEVFVDTDATIAREWAERVFEAYRDDSEPLAAFVDAPDSRDSAE